MSATALQAAVSFSQTARALAAGVEQLELQLHGAPDGLEEKPAMLEHVAALNGLIVQAVARGEELKRAAREGVKK